MSAPGRTRDPADALQPFDLANVRAQEAAKRALEVAAAGGHSILMTGCERRLESAGCWRLSAKIP